MGCCLSSQEMDIQVKRGDMFKYSILAPANASGEWVLTNQETLRTMRISKAGVPRTVTTDSENKVKKLDFHLQAQNPGEETLLFAQYADGKKDAKAIKKVRVKIL